MTGKRRAPGPPVKKSAASRSKQPRTWKQRSLWALKWATVAGLVLALIAGAAFFYLYRTIDIPRANEDFKTQTSRIYYADGQTELGTFATQDRTINSYDEMPDSIKDAVVAAENQTFWTDSGIDVKGILRAVFNNASGGDRQGASTITQQYVKIFYLSQEQSYERKLKEAILALKLQRQITKTELLANYLNTIYFGRGAYGVEAASRAFFDKPAKRLNLRQSAVLASVVNNPTRFDPANGKDARKALKGRYTYVLNSMATLGSISADDRDKALKHLPKFPEVESESAYGGQRGHMLTLVRKELDIWEPGEHNGTFRGISPAFVTAAEAMRIYWSDDALAESTKAKGLQVESRFNALVAAYPDANLTAKGRGLARGLQFESGELAGKVCAEAFSRGLLMETSGPDGEVMKILPALTITTAELEQGLAIIDESVAAVLSAH